jgi:PII-like signaling protein
VYRGIFGFGEIGKIRNVKILDLSFNLPLIIEIVDNKEKIDQVLNYLTEINQNVRITIQDVKTERI